MPTWRDGLEHWRAWAREGGDVEPVVAVRVADFYEALALRCDSLDDEMPAELTKQLKGTPIE